MATATKIATGQQAPILVSIFFSVNELMRGYRSMPSTLGLILPVFSILAAGTATSLAEDQHATGIVRCVAAAKRLAIHEKAGVSEITSMFVFLDKASGIEMNIGCPQLDSDKPYLNTGWDSDEPEAKTIETFARIASFFLGIPDIDLATIRKKSDDCLSNGSAGNVEFESVHIDWGTGFIEIWSDNEISPPYDEAAIQPAKQLLDEYNKPLSQQSKSQIIKYENLILQITQTPSALETE